MDVENTGQVKVASPFGQAIVRYASDSRFTRFVEIGTWNGQGSTCCFYEGFKTRTDTFHLQSYEIAFDRIRHAKLVWQFFPPIEIIHGRILTDSECPTISDVTNLHPMMNAGWHTDDIRNFWSCPYVSMNDPEVVLLDGAEYLTWFEFMKVVNIPSVRVLILDDTNRNLSVKCYKIVEALLANPEWKRTEFSDTERNGWAIFEKI